MKRTDPRSARSYSQLAAWRVEMGYTINQIAAALGISRISWIRYERSDTYPEALVERLNGLERREVTIEKTE